MKSAVEQLSPTRVRLLVEVPFVELRQDFERAYTELAKRVRIPGFRPGKAPARLLEARFGRSAMLDQVIDDILPKRYGQAVTEADLRPLGEPSIEVQKKVYGQELVFTAEVDVRPEIVFPELSALSITVDPVEVSDDDVEMKLQELRTRFGTLVEVQRPVVVGDVVSIDLSATVDGDEVPNSAAEGLSYDVGSDRLIKGLDDAVVGLSADESTVFTAALATGPHFGKEAQVSVTVRAVKERELPEVDEEFVQLASEFDTIAELRANLTDQVSGEKRIAQAAQIRQATLDALLEQVEVALPEGLVQDQVNDTLQTALKGFGHDQTKFAAALEEQGSSLVVFEANARDAAKKALKTQLLLDALADDLAIQVGQHELTERLFMTARQYGVEPQQLLSYLQQNNQLPAVFADVRRGMTIAAVVGQATVVDTAGETIDTSEFRGQPAADEFEAADELEAADEGAAADETDEFEAADQAEMADEADTL